MLKCFSCFRDDQDTKGLFTNKYYKIRSAATGKVLAVSEASGLMKLIVVMNESNEDRQKFKIISNGPDFKIMCLKDKLFLTVDEQSNGERVYGSSKFLNKQQRFRLNEISPGSKQYIILTNFGMSLEVSDATNSDGNIVLIKKVPKESQKWIIECLQTTKSNRESHYQQQILN